MLTHGTSGRTSVEAVWAHGWESGMKAARWWIPLTMVAAGALGLVGCASGAQEGAPVRVVEDLDLERYLGTWHEMASVPIRAQRNCVGTTATYSRRDDGDIEVYNRCLKGGFEGKVSDITARAWVPDTREPAKLMVRFFWPFKSPYWVVALDQDYQWAAVSGPDRENLWILSREPCLDPQDVLSIYSELDRRGFPVGELRATPQQDAQGKRCEVLLPGRSS